MDSTVAGLGIFIIVILVAALLGLNLDSLTRLCRDLPSSHPNYEPISSLSSRDEADAPKLETSV